MVKKLHSIIWILLAALLLAACSSPSEKPVTAPAQVETSSSPEAAVESVLTEVVEAVTPGDSILVSKAPQDTGDEMAAETVVDVTATHVSVEDYDVDSSGAVRIALAGDTISVEGEGAQADGRVVTITAAGTYSFSGILTEGQIFVDTEDDEDVYIILDGIDISNTITAPIFVANASETVITLAANSENYVTDGDTYVFEDPKEDDPTRQFSARMT